MKLVTDRLILRPLKISDAESIRENIDNLKVSQWLLVVPYPYSLEDAKSWIKNNQEKWRKKEIEDYSFGMELKAEKRIIGGIGLHKVNRVQGTGEVGYWIGEKYWRNGYGSEALQAVLDLAFDKLNLRRLEAGVFDGNPSSGKLLEKYGFEREGMRREGRICKADGKLKDEIIYGLLRKEYRR